MKWEHEPRVYIFFQTRLGTEYFSGIKVMAGGVTIIDFHFISSTGVSGQGLGSSFSPYLIE